MCMFNEKESRNLHFPFGVDKDPSPLTRTDAECVIDPPETEEGGNTRMAVSIALSRLLGGVGAVSDSSTGDTVLLHSVSGDRFIRA